MKSLSKCPYSKKPPLPRNIPGCAHVKLKQVFFSSMINNFKIASKRQKKLLSFLITLTTDYEYSRRNRENLLLPVQRQLSQKPNTFCQFFIAFLESTLNFEHY